MKNTKLIIVEGIPGSGKTTTAKYIKELLDKAGIDNELYNEGNLNHPADFEAVACLNEDQYKNLLLKYQSCEKFLCDNVINKADNYFFQYGKLKNEKHEELSRELFDDIIKYDVCDGLSLEKYDRLTLERWREFAEQASREDKVYIFECCFIQNPAVVMLARHFADKSFIAKHILQVENIIRKLNPQLIYFYQDSVRETIARVAEERDKSWINFVIEYICNQAYGKKSGISGFDGVIKFFEDRRNLELDIFEKLEIDKILLNNSEYNWQNRYKEIEEFLRVNKNIKV